MGIRGRNGHRRPDGAGNRLGRLPENARSREGDASAMQPAEEFRSRNAEWRGRRTAVGASAPGVSARGVSAHAEGRVVP
jgi:hypothetical protein